MVTATVDALGAGHAVFPIALLSYKNHALDELLMDKLLGIWEGARDIPR